MNRFRHHVRFSSQPPTTIPAAEVQRDYDFLRKIEEMDYPEPKYASDYEMDLFTGASLGLGDMIWRLTSDKLDKPNCESWTPLMYAAYLGHANVTCLIIRKNISTIDQCDTYGRNAIMLAAACGHTQLVRSLLLALSKVTCTDINQRSALHYAVINKQQSIVELLLEHFANPNLPDVEGMTPTLIAASLEHCRIFETLLQNGGSPYYTNKEGENAEMFIREARNARLTDIFESWRLQKRSNEVIEDLAVLLSIFKLDQYAPVFQRKRVDLQRFLTLTPEDLTAIVGDPGAGKELYTIVEYFTPFGVDPKLGPQADNLYLYYFNEHMKSIDKKIDRVKYDLATRESHLDTLTALSCHPAK